jgi:hypothetical protein
MLEAGLFGGLWRVFETKARKATGSCAEGRMLEAGLFGGLWKVFETKARKATGSMCPIWMLEAGLFGGSWRVSIEDAFEPRPASQCRRLANEWCFGAARELSKGAGQRLASSMLDRTWQKT